MKNVPVKELESLLCEKEKRARIDECFSGLAAAALRSVGGFARGRLVALLGLRVFQGYEKAAAPAPRAARTGVKVEI